MVYAVDFDGTLCISKWPEIGEPNESLIEFLKLCRINGDKVILWTCREGDLLADALRWCKARGLTFDAVNTNLTERIAQYGNNCRKVSADIYLDDKAVGVCYPTGRSAFTIFGSEAVMTADVTLNGRGRMEDTADKGIKGAVKRGLAAIRARIR